MTEDEFREKFDQISNAEYITFESINPDRKLYFRPDINAFLLLDRLVSKRCHGEDRDMISRASRDEIWLRITPEDICERATEEDIRDLIRCGVMLDDDDFSIFVG